MSHSQGKVAAGARPKGCRLRACSERPKVEAKGRGRGGVLGEGSTIFTLFWPPVKVSPEQKVNDSCIIILL